MRLTILGPVGYYRGELWRAPAGVRQQRLLAALLLAHGRFTPVDRLVDALWDRPPATATRQVVNAVSALRAELARHGGPGIGHDVGGYRMDLAGHELDEHLFRGLAARAQVLAGRGDQDAAADLLEQALALWRGPALGGLDLRGLAFAVESLEEQRIAVLEELAGLELRRWKPVEALRLLAEPRQADPFRERAVLLHLVALVGAGRRRDALLVYRRVRKASLAQFGVEPERCLVELHERIRSGAHFRELAAAPEAAVRHNA